MLRFTPDIAKSTPLTLLCIGAHSDDIEIGCGGTVLSLLAERAGVTVHWVVLSADAIREREARNSAARFLRRAASRHVRIEHFPDSFMPWNGAAVKYVFEQLKSTIDPDLVFTHCRQDAHQDHRLVAELTWNTFRDHVILEYEIPKYDGDLGRPNIFVPLNDRIRRAKLRVLMSAFPSQRSRSWFTESTFDALMRLRGIECAAAEGFAEAFHGHKFVLSPAALAGRPTGSGQ
jgi:LmbE family N-acetylglucosaminyl deacetylase